MGICPFANGPAAPASRPACHLRRPPAAGLVGCGPAVCEITPRRSWVSLLRIQLDDELFLHGQIDLFARRDRADLGRHALRVELQPLRHPAALDLFEGVHDRGVLPAALTDPDDVAGLHRERWNVDLAAIHDEMTVAHELPCLWTRGREPESIGHVVEPPFKQLQQRFTSDAARPLRLLEVAAELVLEDPVDALHLLLLAELHSVAGELLLAGLAVLAGREVALLDRALLRVAALALEEQLHALAAAETADRSDVACHSFSNGVVRGFLIRRTRNTNHDHKSLITNPRSYTRRRLVGRQPL